MCPTWTPQYNADNASLCEEIQTLRTTSRTTLRTVHDKYTKSQLTFIDSTPSDYQPPTAVALDHGTTTPAPCTVLVVNIITTRASCFLPLSSFDFLTLGIRIT